MKRKHPCAGGILSIAWLGLLAMEACQTGSAPQAGAPPGDGPDKGESEGAFCGGIAGIPCPAGFVCKDDPHDDCDPDKGGRDCSGICVPEDDECNVPGRQYVSHDAAQCHVVFFLCVKGLVPFVDECGCGCDRAPRGIACGRNHCGSGQFCCNPSCGICAPTGGSCTLVNCD